MPIQSLTLEQRQLISKVRILGSGTALPVMLDDSELSKLIAVILADTGNADLIPKGISAPNGNWDYYQLPLGWFSTPVTELPSLFQLYGNCSRSVSDFDTYFKCLCELHKRRRKYEMIMSAQPLPTMLQVSPRALLEFGVIATPALASWLTWRKWFYDIDNRAAQETGYLFEPILANALGGSPYGARNSPVKRKADSSKGRQVDCIAGTDAYEFKLRVTIAASGQGRFAEELEFASDCRASGFNPKLLVLDPTPNPRLADLAAEFRRVGGEAYIGRDAWDHLEESAGSTMATFIERYVRRPIDAMDEQSCELLDLNIRSNANQSCFQVQLGNSWWTIARKEDDALADAEANGG